MQKLLDQYIATNRLAGASVAVSEGGAPLSFLKAGRIALDTDSPFDQDSVCRVYSMTKPITGLATMLLIEAGKLGLDQPVADILPELRAPQVALDPNKNLQARPATQVMTIRHLLTHSAGFAYWTPGQGTDALSTAYRTQGITPGNYGSGLLRPGFGPQASDLVQMLKRLADLPLAAEPGTAWRYSVGLDVMALVIQRVSGKPLDILARERIFDPLNMSSTGFHVPPAMVPRLTSNYTVSPNGLQNLDPRQSSVFLKPPSLLAGGAGLVSTARDFARIGAMLLGDGRVDKVRIMSVESARLARSNLLQPTVRYDGGGYGAGMRVALGGNSLRDMDGAMSWNGAAGTMWLVVPSRRLNFVLMSQFMPPTAYTIWSEANTALEADCASL
jgi:CubicO group peptidase (beta-lactamase class C family)